MCLTIPGKIKEIRGKKALLETFNNDKRLINVDLIPDVKKGDWILATSGTAVKKIKEKDAKEIIDLLKGQKIVNTKDLKPKFKKILQNAQVKDLKKDESIYLLNSEGKEKEVLFSEALAVRKENIKDFICLHGIIEFSNYCQNNCNYCGLRKDNSEIKRYRMNVDEIAEIALDAVNNIGYKMLVLQSGLDEYYTDDTLVEMIKKIKEGGKCFIFMSVGERSIECYKRMKKAGASGVLFRFETSNQELYQKLHLKKNKKSDFDKRLGMIRELKKMGYYISSGPIIGLPGQTADDLADDILLMKELNIGMVSTGPFVPCDNTPLAEEKNGDPELALKMIAVCRLVMPKSRIPITTALETLNPENARKRGLQSGANSLMFNLTPRKYRANYKIYPNKYHGRDSDLEDFALYEGKESWEMLEKEFKEYV